MRALVYEGPFKVRVRNKPDPTIEHPEDIILKVLRTAICGSDLHLLHGMVPDTRPGCTFGHEFAGVVEEVGRSVKTLKPGDRVVVPFNVACGRCFFCERGLTSCCENTNPASDIGGGAFGYSHMTGGYEGGQAQYVRVPFADIGPMKIPDDMSEEEVLFLSDILPTGYQAAEMGQIQKGETVVVFGCGPVGLFAMKSAWLLGAGRVIGVDHVDDRLDFARAFNKVETIDIKQHRDPVPLIKELTGGRGADVCIDAVGCEAVGSAIQHFLGVRLKMQAGSPTALQWCINSVRRGGNVSIVGVYGPPFNTLPIGTAMNKGLTFRMAQCNTRRYMPHLLQHIRRGDIDAKRVISHRFSLEDAPTAYDMFAKKKSGCIKCVLLPHGEA
jgi:threonine dehydrogenase-like Zn-dependent dehydrogenase